MFVLSRKPGERIVVPDLDLAFTVIAIEGEAVKLGISAPEDLAVYREEFWQRLCQLPYPKEMAGGRRCDAAPGKPDRDVPRRRRENHAGRSGDIERTGPGQSPAASGPRPR
jgi:carbon storage regulator CsrA